MNNRPVIDIPKTLLETLSSFLSLLIAVGSFVYIGLEWSDLPNKVPTHFNIYGEADSWGGKGSIIVPPFVGLFLWALMTGFEQYPNTHNYLWLTEENMERQYQNSRFLLNTIKLELSLFFAYSTWQSVQVSYGHDVGLGVWELPTLLGVLFSTIGYFLYRSYRLR